MRTQTKVEPKPESRAGKVATIANPMAIELLEKEREAGMGNELGRIATDLIISVLSAKYARSQTPQPQTSP